MVYGVWRKIAGKRGKYAREASSCETEVLLVEYHFVPKILSPSGPRDNRTQSVRIRYASRLGGEGGKGERLEFLWGVFGPPPPQMNSAALIFPYLPLN